MFENIINPLIKKYSEATPSREKILNDLFDDTTLKEKYVNPIRRSTIIWKVANEIFEKLGIDDRCKIMAIWDIEYFSDIKDSWQSILKDALYNIAPTNLSWYDLNSQWSQEFY